MPITSVTVSGQPVATIDFTTTPTTAVTVKSTSGGITVVPSGQVTSLQTLSFGGTLVGGSFVLKYNGNDTVSIAWNPNPTIMAYLIENALASINAITTVTFGGLDKVGQGTLIFTQNALQYGPGITTVSQGNVQIDDTSNYGYIVVDSRSGAELLQCGQHQCQCDGYAQWHRLHVAVHRHPAPRSATPRPRSR